MFGAIPDVQSPLLILFVLGAMGVLGIASLWSVFLSAYALYLCLTANRPEGKGE
jgi:hypothetical protein